MVRRKSQDVEEETVDVEAPEPEPAKPQATGAICPHCSKTMGQSVRAVPDIKKIHTCAACRRERL